MKKINLLCLLCFVHFFGFSQSFKVTGFVCNNDSIPMDYFNVVLIDPIDTTFIKGGTFVSGNFQIEGIQKKRVLCEVSYIGYTTKQIVLDFGVSSEVNLGKIILTPTIFELDEVVVRSRNPRYVSQKGKSTLRVVNSTLSDIGDATDLLKRTPKLMVNSEGEVQILGKGNVIVYIDNHMVQNKEELKILNSNEVEKIEVITNPSAKYEADGQAIVKIITLTHKNKGLNATVFGSSVLSRRKSFRGGLYVGYKTNKLYFFSSYNFALDENKNYQGFYRENNRSENVIKTEYKEEQLLKNQKHSYKAGLKYEINDKQYVDFLYTGWTSDKEVFSDIESQYSFEEIASQKLKNLEKPKYTYDSYRFNHSLKLDTAGQKLETAFSYISNKINSLSNYETDNSEIKNRSTGNRAIAISIFKMDYLFPRLIWNTNLEAGIKYSNTASNSDSNFEENSGDSWNSMSDYYRNYAFDEMILSSYINFKKEFGDFSWQLGVRWENCHSKLLFNSEDKLKSSMNNIFPSFNLSYGFSENTIATLSYSKRIKRPSYSLLNPYFKYIDEFTSEQGNPFLKPEFSDIIELSTVIGDNIEFVLGYTRKKDFINYTYSNEEDNPNILRITPTNYDKAELFKGEITYTYYNKANTWEVYNMVGGVKPIVQLYDSGKKRKLIKPTYYISHSQDIKILPKTSLYLGVDLFFPGEDDLFRYKTLQSVSVGIRHAFLKNKLLLSVWCNDIFNSENFDRKLNINGLTVRDYLDGDDTSVRISLRYKIGTNRVKFKQINSEEDRLKNNLK